MIRRAAALAAAVAVAVLSVPTSAQADNCSGLSDCSTGVAIAAAVLAIGVVLAIGGAVAGVLAGGGVAEATAAEGEPPPTESPELKAKLDAIAAESREIIDEAGVGYHVAADNLQSFLDGKNDKRSKEHKDKWSKYDKAVELSADWVRGFGVVTDAERVNQARFVDSLEREAATMKDGETRPVDSDYWDRDIEALPPSQLTWASFRSKLTSTGEFVLTKRGGVVTVTGTVEHVWHDPYDWNPGESFPVLGHGIIYDDDQILLQTHRGAEPFDMRAYWTQTVTGRVGARDLGVGHLLGPPPDLIEWHGP